MNLIKMNQRVEQIVTGEVKVNMTYPTGIEAESSETDSQKTFLRALDKLYEMTPADWDIVFDLAGKVQANLFRLWKSASSSVTLDPEAMLPRIYFLVNENGRRSRYIHLFTEEEWQLVKNSTYDGDRLVQQVVESIKEQLAR